MDLNSSQTNLVALGHLDEDGTFVKDTFLIMSNSAQLLSFYF